LERYCQLFLIDEGLFGKKAQKLSVSEFAD